MPHDGCNMNDKSYPFRGDFKITRELNHGHSGAWKVLPTTLNLKISGSDLKLEQLEVPRNHELQCELGVEGLKPKPIVFQSGHPHLDVPSDGKEYKIHAAISGARSRHFCHLTLVGSSSGLGGSQASHLQMQVSPTCDPLVLDADGQTFVPYNGILAVPLHAASYLIRPAFDKVAPPQTTTQCVPIEVSQGYDHSYLTICLPTGEEIPLYTNQPPVNVPISNMGGSAMRIKLPKPVDVPQSRIGNAVVQTVEAEVRTMKDPVSGQFMLNITARGLLIEVSVDGQVISGIGYCAVPIDTTRGATANMILSDLSSRAVLLRQALHFAPTVTANNPIAIPPPPVVFRIEDNQGTTRTIFTPPEGFVSVDNNTPAAPAERGISFDCSMSRTIVVTQRAPSGSMSTAHVTLPAKSVQDDKWLDALANVLDDNINPVDQLLEQLAAIKAPTSSGARVINGIRRLLAKQPPNFEFTLASQGAAMPVPLIAANLAAEGYRVATAQPGNPLCVIPHGGSIQLHPSQPTKLVALDNKGVVAASAVISIASSVKEPNPEEQLIATMLEMTRANPMPENLAMKLPTIPTASRLGQQLLPELASVLRRMAQPSATADSAQNREIMLQCNVEKDSDLSASMQLDTNPSVRLSLNTPVPIATSTKLLTLKLIRNSLSSPYVQELIDACKRTEPPSLSRRWAEQARPRDQREEELHNILLGLVRDPLTPTPPISAPPAVISFVTSDGLLSNIRCDGLQLSAYVDNLASIGVGQGSQVPQGVPFTDGVPHRIRLIARDSTGSVRAETQVTVSGTKPTPAPIGIAYLDLGFAIEQANLKMKLTAPPALRLSCEIDNQRSVASLANELTVTLDPKTRHAIGVNVSDGTGCILFQQKLDVPPVLAAAWRLKFEKNVLIPSSEPGVSITASVDQRPEKLQDTIPLEHDYPHDILLKRYYGDSGAPCGQLELHVARFVDPDDTDAAADALRSVPTVGDSSLAFAKLELIRNRTPSGILRKLLDEILKKLPLLVGGGGAETRDDFYRKTTSSYGAGGNTPAPTVFFRLRGDEERGAGGR